MNRREEGQAASGALLFVGEAAGGWGLSWLSEAPSRTPSQRPRSLHLIACPAHSPAPDSLLPGDSSELCTFLQVPGRQRALACPPPVPPSCFLPAAAEEQPL